MIKEPIGKIKRYYSSISEGEKIIAKAYIQGAVHSFCSNNKDSELSVRILFGGENKDWANTPLQCIFDYYKCVKNSKDPYMQAAIDVGWLLKEVLYDDTRIFVYVSTDTGNRYKQVER